MLSRRTPEAPPKTRTATTASHIATIESRTDTVGPFTIHGIIRMRNTEANQLHALRATQLFLDRHRNSFPGIATGGARRRLDDTLASIEQHVTDQAGSELAAHGHTQRYRALRRRLIRAHMAPVALIARAAEPPVPELAPFRLPRGKPTAQRLAAVALGMAEAAAPHAATFTAAGLPADFTDQLVRAAESMLEAITAREKELARRRGATEGLRTKLVSARRIVRVLDAFVTTACEEDAGQLAAWASASHVRRAPRRAEEATLAVANMPQLVIPMASEFRVEEPIRHTPDVRRSTALRGRVFALLVGPGRTRIAIGA
jgi:hypothetical protein